MAFFQLARSNRPHELTVAPLVTLIQAVALAALVIGGLRLIRAFRERNETPVGPWHWMLAVLLPLVVLAATLFLAGAAGTAVEVLRA